MVLITLLLFKLLSSYRHCSCKYPDLFFLAVVSTLTCFLAVVSTLTCFFGSSVSRLFSFLLTIYNFVFNGPIEASLLSNIHTCSTWHPNVACTLLWDFVCFLQMRFEDLPFFLQIESKKTCLLFAQGLLWCFTNVIEGEKWLRDFMTNSNSANK